MIFTALFAAALFAQSPAMAIEEPAFTVSAKEGAIELRAYAPMIVAEVTVTGERDRAINQGFRLLADYIFGNNAPNAKIEMTAPVTQAPAGQNIAMTAPVTQTGGGNEWVVRFVMPGEYSLQTLPAPNNPAVRLLEAPGARMAAIRFSGLAGGETLARKTAELEGYIAANGLRAAGPATFAFYDPPWTLPFLRRNEVLIPIAQE